MHIWVGVNSRTRKTNPFIGVFSFSLPSIGWYRFDLEEGRKGGRNTGVDDRIICTAWVFKPHRLDRSGSHLEGLERGNRGL
jgi:hypothetical protein